MNQNQSDFREDWDYAVHEIGHWIFAKWLDVDPVNYVTIVPEGNIRAHVNFSVQLPLDTLQRRLRKGLVLAAGSAAENILLRLGGLNAIPNNGDRKELREMAKGQFPKSEELQHRFIRLLWDKTNDLIQGNFKTAIQTGAEQLFAIKRLEASALDGLWKKLNTGFPIYTTIIDELTDSVKRLE